MRGAMWRQKLDDELLSVPAAPHDDQADACAIAVLDAAMELTAPPESMLVRTVDDLPWRGIVPPPGY